MIFVDASVLLAAEDSDDAHHDPAAGLLELGQALATVDLAAYETTNVALRRWRDPAAAARLGDRIFAIAEYGRLLRADRELVGALTAIADEHGISAYDAAYVAGARLLGAPLASCDERDLVSAGLATLPGALLG